VNLVDLIILGILALAAFDGWRSGFIATSYRLIAWVASFLLAIVAHQPIATALVALTGIAGPAMKMIAIIGLFWLALAAFNVVERLIVPPLLRRVDVHPRVRVAERVAGIAPSLARGLLATAIVVGAVTAVSPAAAKEIDGSTIGSRLAAETTSLQAKLESAIGAEDLLFVTRLDADQQQRLPLPDGLQTAVDPEAERQLFELVNAERGARGLALLAWDEALVGVGRAHAEEMFRLKYFGHISPVTGTPFERIRAAGISFTRVGENLAYAQSVTIAHRGLMESQGHRENILRPDFARGAVGVMSAGIHGRMFVQLFRAP
jgi:uncharacterized protein YkwD/uncharacterized membrane protein required for colicin V production